MTDNNAKVVLAKKVWEQIDWFTTNFTTEIGALGLVSIRSMDGEKCFYVEELLFPKQKVTGATVVFDQETGWGELIKKHGLKGLEKVAFYWHRHPGSAHHSGTDEEHTFETLMGTEANRPYFIFYQTAIGSQGFNEEARIEIRKPIRASITNVRVTVDDPANLEIEKECRAIATACIIKEVTPTYPNYNKGTNIQDSYDAYGRPINKDYSRNYKGQQTTLGWPKELTYSDISHYGNVEPNHLDNDNFKGIPTAEEDKVSLTFENGQVTILAGSIFDSILKPILNDKTHSLTKVVRMSRDSPNKTGTMIKWSLQPISGCYSELKEETIKLYGDYLKALNSSYIKDGTLTNLLETNSQKEKKDLEDAIIADSSDVESEEPSITIETFREIMELLKEMDEMYFVDWIIPGMNAVIRDLEEMTEIGRITIDKIKHEAKITGELVYLLGLDEEETVEDVPTITKGDKKDEKSRK